MVGATSTNEFVEGAVRPLTVSLLWILEACNDRLAWPSDRFRSFGLPSQVLLLLSRFCAVLLHLYEIIVDLLEFFQHGLVGVPTALRVILGDGIGEGIWRRQNMGHLLLRSVLGCLSQHSCLRC